MCLPVPSRESCSSHYQQPKFKSKNSIAQRHETPVGVETMSFFSFFLRMNCRRNTGKKKSGISWRKCLDVLHPVTLSVLQSACLEHGYCVSRIMLTMVDLKGQTERQLANLGFGF